MASDDRERSEEETRKDGERIVAPTRRPDGTLRKAIRIRAGYFPQDEVAIYHPKPALQFRNEMSSHTHDPELHAKPKPKPKSKSKSKSVKRNERKKEKRIQASLEKEKNLEPSVAVVDLLTSRMNQLAVSSVVTTPIRDSGEASEPIGAALDIDKRIRPLRKKIRLTEALWQKTAEQDMKPEQLEKLAKLEDWRKELKLLEDKRTETPAARINY